ncbi:MAG TPA: DUF2332 domain-containing protein [Actinospica sp.]|nr:DUF2332 domain-containing protein [Actinospica sp.]
MENREETTRRFEIFIDREVRESSPLYTALTQYVSEDLAAGGYFTDVLGTAPQRQRIPNLLLASVHRVLFDHPDEELAGYYASLGGTRLPDADLIPAFVGFVTGHRAEIDPLLATGETQTNEVLRGAQLLPAFSWVQATMRRPLGLIEIGPSAGLLLHADRYDYRYEFADGTVVDGGEASADGVPPLHCPIRGACTPEQLAPFVTKPLRVSSRVGLDLNPLSPADPEARAWLRALVWPEHTERRARLEAALEHAARRPVRLRKGDAVRILADAVDSVADNAIPCVFVSNSLPHWSPEGREELVRLMRELGARRDLVFIIKEAHRIGLGLFSGEPDPGAPDGKDVHEVLGAVVYLGGRERLFRLGSAGMHGAWLDWSPQPLG